LRFLFSFGYLIDVTKRIPDEDNQPISKIILEWWMYLITSALPPVHTHK
jgi:hypothetical protein